MLKQLWCVLALLMLVSASAWAAKLYKWTDANGVVHYSDKLPPETVEREHQELNDQGLTTKSVTREKTEAEKMEQLVVEAEQRRLAEEEARLRARDQILLSTFTTEQDLLLTREDRLASVDSIINLTLSNNANLQRQVAETRQRIEKTQALKKEVPQNVTKQLENLEGQLSKNEDFIRIKREERVKLEQQFTDDLKRYRELKGIGADGELEQQAAESATQSAQETTTTPAQALQPPPAEKKENAAAPQP